jgi:hypothetical protein
VPLALCTGDHVETERNQHTTDERMRQPHE